MPPGPSVAPSRREAEHADQYAEPFDADELALDAKQPLDGALGLLVASFADVVSPMMPSVSTKYSAGQSWLSKALQIA
jgi:hypothetical protein